MAGVNRYTQVNYDVPYSSYVKPPLEMLQAVGAGMQDKYDNSLKELNTSSDPIGKLKLQAGLKIYDKSAPGGITDVSTQWENHKSQYLQMLDIEKQSIIDDYLKDQDTGKFNQRKNQYLNKAKMVHSDLASKEQIAGQIVAQNEALSKSESFAKNPAYAAKQISYNTNYINNLLNGNAGEYMAPGVAKEVDMEDVINKDTSNWQKSDLGSTAYTDGQYIHDINTKGITGTRVYDYANRVWNDPNHSARAMANLELEHYLGITGQGYNDKHTYKDYQRDSKGNIVKGKDGQPVMVDKKGKIGDLFMEQKKQDYSNALADKLVHVEKNVGLKSDAYGLYNMKKADAEEEQRRQFEMSIQDVAAAGASTDESFTQVAKSVLGDKFDFVGGKLHYNATQEGDKFVNILGKEISVKDLSNESTSKLKQLFPFAQVGSFTGKGYQIMMPNDKGDWETYEYKVNTKAKNDGLMKDRENVTDMAKRLGYTGKDMDGSMKAVEKYMNTVYNLETQATQFPSGFENYLSNEFNTKLDDKGNILDPGHLANVTIKNANGESIKAEEGSIADMKKNILKGARLSGFSKTLTNDNIKPGDMEMVGSDGQRYIISTGKQNLQKAATKSHRLLTSVNNYVMKGNKSIDTKEADVLETGISSYLNKKFGANITKGAINVTNKEVDSRGNEYITYIINGPNGEPQPGTLIFKQDPKTGTYVPQANVPLMEAARLLDSDGTAEHVKFFNPKSTDRFTKDDEIQSEQAN